MATAFRLRNRRLIPGSVPCRNPAPRDPNGVSSAQSHVLPWPGSHWLPFFQQLGRAPLGGSRRRDGPVRSSTPGPSGQSLNPQEGSPFPSPPSSLTQGGQTASCQAPQLLPARKPRVGDHPVAGIRRLAWPLLCGREPATGARKKGKSSSALAGLGWGGVGGPPPHL